MAERKLTENEYLAIEKHNRLLIAGADTSLVDLRDIPVRDRTDIIKGRIAYWAHVKSALHWSTEIAKQRLAKGKHGTRSNI